ncbi:MAG: TraB/GumN family protein [Clostridia bacterium]|nr:TraB/GumN family protein [Clostridia bacterium]
MKRYLTFFLALIIALSFLGGCDKIGTNSTTTTTNPITTTTQPISDVLNDNAPMMWRVTGENGQTLYLFGTVHVGDKRNEAVLSRIAPTMDSCDALAVEFDSVAYQEDLKTMMQDMAQYVYADGTKITDHLPNDLYKKCVNLMKDANLYMSALDYYNVSMWYQYADNAALLKHSNLLSDYGMETLLLDKAYKQNMEVLSVESGSFQMALLNSFPEELFIFLLQNLFANIDTYGKSLDELYTAWLDSDFEKFTACVLADSEVGELSPELIAMIDDYNKKLMDDRNVGMADKAEEYIKSGKTIFFAVGAAHMVGETGLVKTLTDRGYTVERVSFTQAN